MDAERQPQSARNNRDPEAPKALGKTCIDCHKAIAHELPKGSEEPEAQEAKAGTGTG